MMIARLKMLSEVKSMRTIVSLLLCVYFGIYPDCHKMTMLALWRTSRCTRADKLVTFPVPSTPKGLCCGLLSWAALCCQTIILSCAFSAKIVTVISRDLFYTNLSIAFFSRLFYRPIHWHWYIVWFIIKGK